MMTQQIRTPARSAMVAALKQDKDHAKKVAGMKRMDALQPADYQEKHDPTESVQVVLSHTTGMKIDDRGEHAVRVIRTIEQGRQRIVDARLASSLGGDRLDAMEEIYAGFCALISGLGMKPASVERASKSNGGISDGQAALASDYNRWIECVDNALFLDQDGNINRHGKPMTFGKGKAAARWTLERLCPEAATAIICHGKTITHVSLERGKHKNWIRDNLKQAIDVWLCMKNKQEWPDYGFEDDTIPLTMKQVLTRQLNRKVTRVKHADAIEADYEKRRVIRSAA